MWDAELECQRTGRKLPNLYDPLAGDSASHMSMTVKSYAPCSRTCYRDTRILKKPREPAEPDEAPIKHKCPKSLTKPSESPVQKRNQKKPDKAQRKPNSFAFSLDLKLKVALSR